MLLSQRYRIHMDIGIAKHYLGIQAIVNGPPGKRTWYSLTCGTLTNPLNYGFVHK